MMAWRERLRLASIAPSRGARASVRRAFNPSLVEDIVTEFDRAGINCFVLCKESSRKKGNWHGGSER
jgi:hypothetical protein